MHKVQDVVQLSSHILKLLGHFPCHSLDFFCFCVLYTFDQLYLTILYEYMQIGICKGIFCPYFVLI